MNNKSKKQAISCSLDLSDSYFVQGEQINKDSDLRKLIINISEDSKKHCCMSYTTEIGTLGLIFQNMTLRSSSLSNANLNDPMEKERVGVYKFAHGRFITCFCQLEHESIPFWMNYGKNIRQNKVLLQFDNFASKFEDCFFTDYAFVRDNKKTFFKSENYGKIINSQLSDDRAACEEYDLRAYIDTLLMFDVEYVPLNSEVFKENNTGEVSADFSLLTGQKDSIVKMFSYDPTVLGKQKSQPWDYEKETRVMCILSPQDFSEWSYIDLRLKPEAFRGLKIILSPWDNGELRNRVEKIITDCTLPKDIKESITVVDSGLKSKLNFPEYLGIEDQTVRQQRNRFRHNWRYAPYQRFHHYKVCRRSVRRN